jgi:antitoxin CptB
MAVFLARRCSLSLTRSGDYIARMPLDPDLKRLAWRAHHRGTREADMLVGGFFDAHHACWGAEERSTFAEMLDHQDVDIIAWAHGTARPPERFEGSIAEALRKLDYVRAAR